MPRSLPLRVPGGSGRGGRLLAAVFASWAVVGCGGAGPPMRSSSAASPVGVVPAATVHAPATSGGAGLGVARPVRGVVPAARRPNIVFVLTDDLSRNLLPYMPDVQAIGRRGTTFLDYFVTDSLCCPSRSSIFTGRFPHDTGVFGNAGPDGGFHVFYSRGEERRTFAVALQRVGYQTAMMGKYLNGYLEPGSPVDTTYVPPGWNEWDVAGNGYPEFGYVLNENGQLVQYGDGPRDYMTDVLARKGGAFIDRAARAKRPFFLEIATFAPHGPFIPAPRNSYDFPGLKAPRPPNFDALPSDPPGWLAGRAPFSPEEIARIDHIHRLRAEQVEAVDLLLVRLQARLIANGLDGNTVIAFSSDNGFHMGQYRLMPGKLTAFDSDIRVPLIVAGPGVKARQASTAITENIDLAETFAELAGTHLARDGHSLVSLLRGLPATGWRTAALVEHHGPDLLGVDPDRQQPPEGNPPTYEAIRSARSLYVEYRDGSKEYYDLRTDPYELHNVQATLTLAQAAALHHALTVLASCHGSHACWAAGHPALP